MAGNAEVKRRSLSPCQSQQAVAEGDLSAADPWGSCFGHDAVIALPITVSAKAGMRRNCWKARNGPGQKWCCCRPGASGTVRTGWMGDPFQQ